MTDNREKVKALEGERNGREWQVQFLIPSIYPVIFSLYSFSFLFLSLLVFSVALEGPCLSVSLQDANFPSIIFDTSILVHRVCRCRIRRPGT